MDVPLVRGGLGQIALATNARGILAGALTEGGLEVAEQSWTHERLLAELDAFEQDLRAAGLRENSVRTYTDRTRTFLRWLVGEYTPQGPVA
ncbi:MAG: hypothetical protein ACLFV0_05665 [Nitriliruptoraceae bacterium]